VSSLKATCFETAVFNKGYLKRIVVSFNKPETVQWLFKYRWQNQHTSSTLKLSGYYLRDKHLTKIELGEQTIYPAKRQFN